MYVCYKFFNKCWKVESYINTNHGIARTRERWQARDKGWEDAEVEGWTSQVRDTRKNKLLDYDENNDLLFGSVNNDTMM